MCECVSVYVRSCVRACVRACVFTAQLNRYMYQIILIMLFRLLWCCREYNIANFANSFF